MSGLSDPEVAEAVLRHITGMRWFAGKGRRCELRGVTALPWLTAVGQWPAVRFEIAEIGYPPDPEAEAPLPYAVEHYQLAVSYRPAPVTLMNHAEIARLTDRELGAVVGYDAMQDRDACQLIMGQLIGEAKHRDPHGRVAFHLSAGEGLSTDLEPQFYTGQQSNTSVMFGDVAMIKLFRRLELGRNLDIEVHDALSRAGNADVARLFGWIEGSWDASHGETLHADLAMAVEKLADAQDGWGLALDSLRNGTDFTADAAALGRALAETHHALREAFPTAHVAGSSVAAVMRERLHRATVIAPGLGAYGAGLDQAFADLGAESLAVQRVHGDFHLGQTLHTPTGWKIIDFEGEPAKTLAERVAPDSVWRDIAGMLRSFDYAAASVPSADSGAWAAACRKAFLAGYAGGSLDSADVATLRAYEADKAIYEVTYEIRNRPDWVGIPLGAIALLSQPSTEA